MVWLHTGTRCDSHVQFATIKFLDTSFIAGIVDAVPFRTVVKYGKRSHELNAPSETRSARPRLDSYHDRTLRWHTSSGSHCRARP